MNLPERPAVQPSPARKNSAWGWGLLLLGLAGALAMAWWFGASVWILGDSSRVGLAPGSETSAPPVPAAARQALPGKPLSEGAVVAAGEKSLQHPEAASGRVNGHGHPGRPAPDVKQQPPEPSGPARDPAAALALFGQGQELFEAARFQEAAELFKKAVTLDPVNAEIASWQVKTAGKIEAAQRQNDAQRKAVEAFGKKQFDMALRSFYRLQETQSAGPYEKYIRNSWYNWGLQLLAAGNLHEADVKMNEVLNLDAGDVEAQRVKELISNYNQRPKDNLFYLRIQELRYRPLDS